MASYKNAKWLVKSILQTLQNNGIIFLWYFYSFHERDVFHSGSGLFTGAEERKHYKWKCLCINHTQFNLILNVVWDEPFQRFGKECFSDGVGSVGRYPRDFVYFWKYSLAIKSVNSKNDNNDISALSFEKFVSRDS